MSFLGEELALPESLENLRRKFATAKPFPHITIDDMFSERLLEHVADEIPQPAGDDCARDFNNLCSAVDFGDPGFQLVAFVHSASFLYFLSELTGIWELLPDPYLRGGGYHLLTHDSTFDVDSGHNQAQESGLTRRLSLVIYLDKNWKGEYEGQLELSNGDKARRELIIEPLFNRTIVLETINRNGVRAVGCPDGPGRRFILIHYYTVGVDKRKGTTPYASMHVPSFYGKNRKSKWTLRGMVKDITPPIVLRSLNMVRARKDPKEL
jgi:hypothetical protein